MPDASRIVALLGPTNTGKTHRAVERMLEHESGIIGLPLRLLAREVYDRVSTRIGRDAVALVTGEEKIVPPRPRYWVATVEAMPLGRDVAFVAVDEIQLASHRERGHVFTDRLLHARGTNETWFMGSDSMRPLMRTLVPTAQIEEHPRLSRLTYSGATTLGRLPPRSAVVAFSMEKVYEIAERLRVSRGGAAVVLGALSPRTRNAQVAMFQAGEVDAIVATDAIGMGLNLDIAHAAFAARHKFDGRELRELEDAELGQIAGRAGRYVTDGTFGTVAPLELPQGAIVAIESHRFPPVRRARYRPHLLDFTSAQHLLDSLRVAPQRPGLVSVEAAEDQRAFERLAAMPEVRRTLTSAEAVERLWEVASIPDFRKLLFEAYVEDLREIYMELATRGTIRSELFEERIAPLAAAISADEVETLLARITALRTWAYVANKGTWVEDGARFRDETRVLEERLSDALHLALTARFVESARRRTKAARPRPATRDRSSSTSLEDPRPRPDHPFSALRDFVVDRDAPPPVPAEDDLGDLADAPHEAFSLAESGTIESRDVALARLTAGPRLVLPRIRMLDVDIRPGVRVRLERRLLAYARDVVSRLLAPFADLAHASKPSLRGLAHVLEEGLGTVRTREAKALLADLDADDRALLDERRIVIGRASIYAAALLEPGPIATRAILLRTFGRAVPRLAPATTSLRRQADDRVLIALGFVPIGPRAIRADLAERVVDAALAPGELAPIASMIGCGRDEAERVIRAARDRFSPEAPQQRDRAQREQGEEDDAADGDDDD